MSDSLADLQQSVFWFVPDASRDLCEAFLKDRAAGSFVVRRSASSADQFTLSVKSHQTGAVAHVRLCYRNDVWFVADEPATTFDSLPLLLRAQPAVAFDLTLQSEADYRQVFHKASVHAPLPPSAESDDVALSFADEFNTWKIDASDLKIDRKKRLGEGHFSVVWLAKRHGEKVAVKQLKESSVLDAAAREKSLRTFQNEVRRMTTLPPHQNVVTLYGTTLFADGSRALVMQFCARGSLQNALYGPGRLDWTLSELVRVAHEVACGLAHLHRFRCIHRDVASRNVLLTGPRDLVAKVSDFGLARVLRSDRDEDETRTKIGAVLWLSPEQLQNMGHYSMRSDVFAFGVLLFEIFARERPWSRFDAKDVIRNVLDGHRMTPPPINSHRFADVRALMNDCWAHEPSARPTMFAVHDRLDAMRGDSDEEDDDGATSDNLSGSDGYSVPKLL